MLHATMHTFMKHPIDATSGRMWVEENKQDVFYYQCAMQEEL